VRTVGESGLNCEEMSPTSAMRAEFDVVADVSAEPATSGNAKFCEEAPIAHGDVGHDAWRAEKIANRAAR